jgi:heterotetrameric sarcosine oxidase delta subunit
MLALPCPWCGERDEVEFTYGGQAEVSYPPEPGVLSDEAWAQYLFVRDNPKGPFRERWVHTHGCRRWFDLERDTLTHEIHLRRD